jgi:hypothetical protein
MSEDDPFADLGDTLDDDTGDDAEEEADADAATEEGTQDTHDPMNTPAFAYDDAVQRPFYAEEETVDDFDAWLNYELERELNERGYQDINVREMTDAVLRTIVEEGLVGEVAERFEEGRE